MTVNKECINCTFSGKDEYCISDIRLFRSLSQEAQEDLIHKAVHKSYKRGESIVRDGMPINSILIVKSGRIKTCRMNPDGEEQVLDVLHDGQAIWHGMFLQNAVYHYSVVALSDVEICEISRISFERTLANKPEAAMSLITMLSTELDEAEEKAMMLGIRDPKKRLAKFLLHRDERCIGNDIHMKLDDIAASIGLRPETVSRSLSYFEKNGYIERKGQGRLHVIDHERLRSYLQ